MRKFIRDNREEIDRYIRQACPDVGKISDRERELWVLNDECLYRWARSRGVNC